MCSYSCSFNIYALQSGCLISRYRYGNGQKNDKNIRFVSNALETSQFNYSPLHNPHINTDDKAYRIILYFI